MQNLRNKLIAGGAVLILAAIGTMMNRQAAQAQGPGGPVVTIGSPLPLPVTGTVAATQSGPWNVNLAGTPAVNINNSPTVGLAAGTTIVGRNLDDPGRIPYQFTVLLQGTQCSSVTESCVFNFPTVPSAHRLVVQRIGGILRFNSAPAPSAIVVNVDANGGYVTSFLAPFSSSVLYAAFDRAIQFYVDGSRSASVAVDLLPGTFISNLPQAVTLIGYELDCNAASCAAIAP